MLDPRKFSRPGIGSSNLSFGDPLAKTGGIQVVFWHGGLAKNHTPNTVPLAQVILKQLHPDSVFGTTSIVDAAISHLGSLRPGSVWKNGGLVGEIGMDKLAQTKVDFNPGQWRWVTAKSSGLLESYLRSLPTSLGGSWLIEMRADGDKTILLPCLEFFTRCYGRSSETTRLLATYGLQELQKEYLYGYDSDPEAWVLKLERRVSEREAPFLAHAMFDDYTYDICKRLHSALQAEFKPHQNAFIQVEPWFRGFAHIEGRGYWISPNVFLMLNVDGMSHPKGRPIIVERQHYERGDGIETGMEGRSYTQNPPPGSSNSVVSITDTDAPSSNTSRVVHDPPFRTLGPKRKINRRKLVKPGRGGNAMPASDPETLAPGDARRDGKGGGKAEFVSPDGTPEGSLAQMWQTCVHLAETLGGYITEVGWYTKEAGFQTDGVPRFEYIQSVRPGKEGVSKRAAKKVFIIRMTAAGRHIYILELFRKPRSSTVNDVTTYTEDGYRGLMVQLPYRKQDVDLELGVIFKNIISYGGRIKKTTMSNYPHVTFVHKPREAEPEPVAFRKVVLNNLTSLIGPVNVLGA
ncbi:hypothetical protein [Pseudomonas viridiflava]|uniref:hypothetical protein n=1 Tax=Pseudomonas viridiflava TaxID=33069 RepID=UPI000F01E1AE|nr:hypothetical protein [Pseudomonas viridiflava]